MSDDLQGSREKGGQIAQAIKGRAADKVAEGDRKKRRTLQHGDRRGDPSGWRRRDEALAVTGAPAGRSCTYMGLVNGKLLPASVAVRGAGPEGKSPISQSRLAPSVNKWAVAP